MWWEVAVLERDTILDRGFQDLAHAMKDHFLEFGGHVLKSSLSHERDNAFDTGRVFCTVCVPFVLEKISDSLLPLLRVEEVIATLVWAVSLPIESPENAVICSHIHFGGGTGLPVIPSISDIRVGSKDEIASASYTHETLG